MGRSPCCSKVGLRRGPWSTKEDNLLTNYIQQHGEGQWRSLPKQAGLLRCGKSCRLRWMNYLRPGIKRGNISEDEEDLIVRLHGLLGNRWSLIAGRLPGRTDNEIKNYWNTHLLKKLKTAGVDLRPSNAQYRNPPEEETNKVKKKQHKKKKVAAAAAAPEMQQEKEADVLPERAKAYLPKPVRVSPKVVFSRTESYESLASRTTTASSSSEAAAVASEGMAWPPPLFELEDPYGDGCEQEDYLLGGGGYLLPLLCHHAAAEGISDDVEMLERVYDEYLQLL